MLPQEETKTRTIYTNFFSRSQYLNQGSIQDRNLNDTQDYKLMSESMEKVGFSSQEKDNIFRIVAAVMHLGNVAFEEELDDKKGTVRFLKPMYNVFTKHYTFALG